MQSPLRLDEFVIESLHVRTRVDESPVRGSAHAPTLDVHADVLRAGEELRFLIPLTVRVNHKPADYRLHGFALDLKLLGFFSFDQELDEDQVNHLITLNAPSILYGIARGIVAQVMALTNTGKHILPSVNFVELMRQRAERRGRGRARTAPPAYDDAAKVPDDGSAAAPRPRTRRNG